MLLFWESVYPISESFYQIFLWLDTLSPPHVTFKHGFFYKLTLPSLLGVKSLYKECVCIPARSYCLPSGPIDIDGLCMWSIPEQPYSLIKILLKQRRTHISNDPLLRGSSFSNLTLRHTPSLSSTSAFHKTWFHSPLMFLTQTCKQTLHYLKVYLLTNVSVVITLVTCRVLERAEEQEDLSVPVKESDCPKCGCERWAWWKGKFCTGEWLSRFMPFPWNKKYMKCN